jgi:MFS family permease
MIMRGGPKSSRGEFARMGVLVFLQMLPATLVTPAIRPLFAVLHRGNEGAMHAFMALNMAGAVLAVPFISRFADRLRRPKLLFGLLAIADAILLSAAACPGPVVAILVIRALEGAAHVSAATLLLARAATLGRERGEGRAMGIAGSALILAIALGSGVGALVLGLGPRAPFALGSLLLLAVGAEALSSGPICQLEAAPSRRTGLSLLRRRPELAVPLSAAFVERFTVGCFVVTFSLFVHHAHGLSDRAIGGLFTLLTLPFALTMYPASRLGERVPRPRILALGAALYAGCFLMLRGSAAAALPALMIVAGIASGMIYAPALCETASLAGPEDRGLAMALLNGAGCLGMLMGPAAAGITVALFRSPADPLCGYRAVFTLNALTLGLWLASIVPVLLQRNHSGHLLLPAAGPLGAREAPWE